MAKKIKRKVSTIGQSLETSQTREAVVEQAVADTSASGAAPRTFNRRAATSMDFNPDYTYVRNDLKRIGILAGSFFALLIALSFIMPLIIK